MSPEQRISTRPCLSLKQKVNGRMKQAAETKTEMLLGRVAYDSHTQHSLSALSQQNIRPMKIKLDIHTWGPLLFSAQPLAHKTRTLPRFSLTAEMLLFFSARSSGEVLVKYEPRCHLIRHKGGTRSTAKERGTRKCIILASMADGNP